MSQNDMTVDNSTGANVRADINSALQALATNSSGSSAHSTNFAFIEHNPRRHGEAVPK